MPFSAGRMNCSPGRAASGTDATTSTMDAKRVPNAAAEGKSAWKKSYAIGKIFANLSNSLLMAEPKSRTTAVRDFFARHRGGPVCHRSPGRNRWAETSSAPRNPSGRFCIPASKKSGRPLPGARSLCGRERQKLPLSARSHHTRVPPISPLNLVLEFSALSSSMPLSSSTSLAEYWLSL